MAEFVEVVRLEYLSRQMHDSTVTCPVHGMKFDVTTGCFAGTSARKCRTELVATPRRNSLQTFCAKPQIPGGGWGVDVPCHETAKGRCRGLRGGMVVCIDCDCA